MSVYVRVWVLRECARCVCVCVLTHFIQAYLGTLHVSFWKHADPLGTLCSACMFWLFEPCAFIFRRCFRAFENSAGNFYQHTV